jgi:hypothetical protein
MITGNLPICRPRVARVHRTLAKRPTITLLDPKAQAECADRLEESVPLDADL